MTSFMDDACSSRCMLVAQVVFFMPTGAWLLDSHVIMSVVLNLEILIGIIQKLKCLQTNFYLEFSHDNTYIIVIIFQTIVDSSKLQ